MGSGYSTPENPPHTHPKRGREAGVTGTRPNQSMKSTPALDSAPQRSSSKPVCQPVLLPSQVPKESVHVRMSHSQPHSKPSTHANKENRDQLARSTPSYETLPRSPNPLLVGPMLPLDLILNDPNVIESLSFEELQRHFLIPPQFNPRFIGSILTNYIKSIHMFFPRSKPLHTPLSSVTPLYPLIRGVGRDGDCFYRSVLVILCEHLIFLNTHAPFYLETSTSTSTSVSASTSTSTSDHEAQFSVSNETQSSSNEVQSSVSNEAQSSVSGGDDCLEGALNIEGTGLNNSQLGDNIDGGFEDANSANIQSNSHTGSSPPLSHLSPAQSLLRLIESRYSLLLRHFKARDVAEAWESFINLLYVVAGETHSQTHSLSHRPDSHHTHNQQTRNNPFDDSPSTRPSTRPSLHSTSNAQETEKSYNLSHFPSESSAKPVSTVELYRFLNDPLLSFHAVSTLRLLTSAQLRESVDLHMFVDTNDIFHYCQEEIEQMHRDADHVQMVCLLNVLQLRVPVVVVDSGGSSVSVMPDSETVVGDDVVEWRKRFVRIEREKGEREKERERERKREREREREKKKSSVASQLHDIDYKASPRDGRQSDEVDIECSSQESQELTNNTGVDGGVDNTANGAVDKTPSSTQNSSYSESLPTVPSQSSGSSRLTVREIVSETTALPTRCGLLYLPGHYEVIYMK